MHFLDRLATEIRRIAEFNEIKLPAQNEDGDVVISGDIGKFSRPEVVVCPRKLH
jgi:hypothetical protein